MPSDRQIDFRPLRREDLWLLERWFAEPHVARWWHEPSEREAIESKYGPRVEGLEATSMWIIEIGGQPAGLAQHYLHSDYRDHDSAVGIPDAVGVDYLLGADYAGRGLGPAVLADLARRVLAVEPSARCCVATPAQENRPSWIALERAGFVRAAECQPPDEPPAWCYVWEHPEAP